MTPHETALITTLLGRLKTMVAQPKDADAELLIQQATAEQPDAAHQLAQTVLIQDLSLYSSQTWIAELERNLAGAKIAASSPTSFLGELLNTDQRPSQAAEPAAPDAAAPPWSALTSQRRELAPAPNAQTVSGVGTGDFLHAAAVTAALITQR